MLQNKSYDASCGYGLNTDLRVAQMSDATVEGDSFIVKICCHLASVERTARNTSRDRPFNQKIILGLQLTPLRSQKKRPSQGIAPKADG